MKSCRRCGEIQELSAYSKCSSAKDGVQSVCKACVKRRHHQVQEFLATLKSAPCTDCGGRFHPAAMDFDHMPGKIKIRAVARMTLNSFEAILAEIDKCELVCSNCHRVRTYNRLRGKHGD